MKRAQKISIASEFQHESKHPPTIMTFSIHLGYNAFKEDYYLFVCLLYNFQYIVGKLYGAKLIPPHNAWNGHALWARTLAFALKINMPISKWKILDTTYMFDH